MGNPEDQIEPAREPETLEDYKRIVAIRNLANAMVTKVGAAIDEASLEYIDATNESLNARVQFSAIVSTFQYITRLYLESLELDDAIGIRAVPDDVTQRAIEIMGMEKQQFGNSNSSPSEN
jgi:hypothetical protein